MKNKLKVCAALGAISFATLGSLSSNVFADITYTSTNFPDEAFFNCVKMNASVEESAASITKTQAESITNLSCPKASYQFSNTTGIELLTGLKKLTIEGQKNLETLDLSKNTALSGLIGISDNPKLKTLKFGQAPGIETLFANHNALTSLDISGLAGLSYLNVTDNALASINVSKNKALNTLLASKNQLSDIDLSSNGSLKSAYLYDNKFKNIDVSKINKSLLGLWLDDNVLVRTNFVAVQTTNKGNYYASSSTNGGTDGMFSPMILATGLGGLETDRSTITTPGATFHNNDGQCGAGDAFCIIIDSNILNYQNYVQLKYTGQPASEANIADGMDKSKRNYRLEINLEAYTQETSPSRPGTRTPNTGVFSEEDGSAVGIIISLTSIAALACIIYSVAYGAKRYNNKVKFTKSKF